MSGGRYVVFVSPSALFILYAYCPTVKVRTRGSIRMGGLFAVDLFAQSFFLFVETILDCAMP